MRIDVNQPTKQWQIDMFKNMSKNPDTALDTVNKVFVVLCTPRSGSTFFCESLYRTGQIGMIEEWFNYEYFVAGCKALKIDDFDLETYVRWVIRKSVRGTGVFGVKWHIAQVYAMAKDFKFDLSNMQITNLVYVRRRNKIDQAVSFARAVKRNQFRSYEQVKGNDGIITMSDIASGLYLIAQHEDSRKALGFEDAPQYHYEDFTDEYYGSEIFDEVLKSLGKPGGSQATTRVKRQADCENLRLVEEFESYLRGDDWNV